MAASDGNLDSIRALYKCKACLYVVNEAVKLACGHRVCGDLCLNQLCANLPVARCPVTSCGAAIDITEVTADDVFRKAVFNFDKTVIRCPYRRNGCARVLSPKDVQVHQTDCRFRTNGHFPELQTSNVNVLTDAENSTLFQETMATLRRDLTFLSEEQARIQRMSRSMLEGLSKLQNDVEVWSEQQRQRGRIQENTFKLSNDVKQLSQEIKDNFKRFMMTMAHTGEAAIVQQRRTDEQLEQHGMAISRNTTAVSSNARQIHVLQQHIRRQQSPRPVYRPVKAEIGLFWKITGYRQKKEMNKIEVSEAFLASNNSYRMCVQIYFNGDGCGKGSHVSLYFALMKSKIDHILTWPFGRKVKLMILDQNSGGCHHVDDFMPIRKCKDFEKPQDDMNTPVGIPKFISHLELETAQYVKDDTLYLQIEVE